MGCHTVPANGCRTESYGRGPLFAGRMLRETPPGLKIGVSSKLWLIKVGANVNESRSPPNDMWNIANPIQRDVMDARVCPGNGSTSSIGFLLVYIYVCNKDCYII